MATYMNQTNSGRIIVQQTNPTAIIVQPDNERKIILKGTGGLKGETGEPGPAGEAATIAVGTTSTLAPGASATVTNRGTSSAAVFDFGIPKGEKGDTGATGPANTLSIGTVTKGDTADATITGDAPNQTLNLVLPKGDKGDTGSQGPAGQGVITGGTTGQVLTKKSGTDYDTEWTTPTTYSDFTGATSSVAGAHGLVPAPTTSDPDKFLKGDGTWGTPPGTTYTAGTGIDISGSTIAVDTDTVSMKSEYTVKKAYTIDLTAQSTSNFYPVVFTRTQNVVDCEIHSEGGGSGIAYNQNVLHFQMVSQGWSDLNVRKRLIVLQEGAYDVSEITIGCVGLGDHQGNNCVWLRGGIKYFFTCNVTAEAHTSSYTIGDETFSVGTNYYGGTNANVAIYYTPQNVNKDVALIEDVDSRMNLYRYTKSQYNSSGSSWYYPIANLPIDDSDNSCSVIINGRIGGWTNTNMAKIDLLLTNRSNYSGDNITASGSIKGPYTGALGVCNVVVYKQTNKSAIVYLKCDGYFAFDITADYYQTTKSWTGNYTTTPSGTLIWSTATTTSLEKVDQNGVIYGVLADTAGSVKTANIDALAVTTAKIDDGAVTAAKIASGVIPTVNDATLTITQNGSTLGTFTANASSNVTIDVPGGGSSYTAGVGIEIANDTIEVDDTVALIDDPTTSETPTPWVETSMIENDAVTPEKASFTAYSTAEQVVGTWIDGKPLYRKTINFGALPNATTKSVSHGLSNFRVRNFYGVAVNPSTNTTFYLPTLSGNTTAFVTMYIDSGNVIIDTMSTNRSAFTECYITIEYIKTTD